MTSHSRRVARGAALAATLVLSVALAGCADMSGVGGTSHFACKAPAGVQCNSVSGNYANALQNNLPSQLAGRTTSTAVPAPLTSVAPARVVASLPPLDGPADALRSRPRVNRLWINAWEDQDHDLVDQSYVYVQVDDGRWLVDHARAKVREGFAPLRAVVAAKAERVEGNPAPAQPAALQEPPSATTPSEQQASPVMPASLPDAFN